MTTDLACSPSLCSHFGTERVDLFDDQSLHSFDAVLFFEAEVKDLHDGGGVCEVRFISDRAVLRTYGIAVGFVIGVMPNSEVGVVERFFAADTPGGIEAEHTREEVDGQWVGLREERRERDARANGQRADIVLSL